MYMCSNFKQLYRKWTHRTVHESIFSDIYDSQIWKEFANKESIILAI
ncbi:433_t:CDS:2 [Cetraspora pellucida]|uniref:433_t:CDS:1 n=1 Tax=Cetraspora pellucida TaxID=1433469 RepID=A0ACA9KTL0_9GLOM|nr:433_t:CDS:2 [Cetraspora pellucida]